MVVCEVLELPADHLEERSGREFKCMPQVRKALPHRCAKKAGAAAG
jgi:hypothetical protein